jgi:hypothetical protein
MGKKSPPRHHAKSEFRESDFAGMQPKDQAQLSGSLNRLSQELESTRQLLNSFEREAVPTAPAVSPQQVPPVSDGKLQPPGPAVPPATPEK